MYLIKKYSKTLSRVSRRARGSRNELLAHEKEKNCPPKKYPYIIYTVFFYINCA
jgi:hypothetical protein